MAKAKKPAYQPSSPFPSPSDSLRQEGDWLSLLERPVGSASTADRTWYGYSAYNPEVIVKILTIFQVFYNYMLAGGDKKTSAMRVGVVGSRVDYKSVINYNG